MSGLRDEQFHSKGLLYPFLKRLLGRSMKYKRWFWGFVGFVSVTAIIDAVFLLLWSEILDKAIVPLAGGDATALSDFKTLLYYSAVYLGMALVQVVAIYYFIRFAGYVEEYVMYDLRQDMFNKLQELDFAFYDKSAVGWLLSRISSDAQRVTQVISWGLLEGVWGMVMIVICLAAMFTMHWQLALIVLVSIPLLVLISVRIRLIILRYSRQSRKINSELTASYNEHINGVEVNKSTAQEERAGAEFRDLSSGMRGASYKASYYTAMYLPLVIFMGSVVAMLIIYVGGSMGVQVPPGISIGVLAAFFGYATRIFEPIYDISHFYAMAQGSISAGERIFSLLDTPVQIQDAPGATELTHVEGRVEFRNVSFYYEANKPVLKNVNLDVRPGESIALVGETGGGKSTIVSLLCRFYDVQEGGIYLDGQDIRSKSMASLRRHMGIVLQTPHLFSGSIRENLCYARQDAGDAEIRAALELVGAEELLARLDEEVGESGEKLSLGERQLISFARAVLVNPRIFIMDEATSSIDALTEMRIQKGIEEMLRGRSSFIIAHRLSTIRNCDRILYVHRGEIVEEGSHNELMQRKAMYYKLYTSQLRAADSRKCPRKARRRSSPRADVL